jgi:hypothetical protein
VKQQYKTRWQQILRLIPKQGITRTELGAKTIAMMKDNHFRQVLHTLVKHRIVLNRNGCITINTAYIQVIQKVTYAP